MPGLVLTVCRRGLVGLLVVVALSITAAGAQAQPESTPKPLTDEQVAQRRVEMEQKLEGLLKELELFYKPGKDKAGHATFTVIFEEDGKSSKLELSIKQPGKFRHEPLWVLYTYTPVSAVDEGQLPPEVIAKVAEVTDQVIIGNYSISENHRDVFTNSSAYLNQMSAGELWLTLALTHANRIEMIDTLQPLLPKKN